MRSTVVGAVWAMLLVPCGAAAQACLGIPGAEGTNQLEGVFTTTEGRKTYGARGIFNVPGPASVYATYDISRFDDVNERGQTFGGGAALELQVPSVSMCPVGGASYFRLKLQDGTSALTFSETVVPIGLAVGKTLPAGPGLFVVLFGQPEFRYIRAGAELNDPILGTDSQTDTQNEFGFRFGMRIGTNSFYGGAGVELSTIDQSDPIFSLVGALGVGD